MGFWSNVGHALWNTDSVKNTCQSLSNVACCVPVFGNVAAVALEGVGMVAGMVEGKEPMGSVIAQGLTGMAVAAIPFGKVVKVGASVAMGVAKVTAKEAAEIAIKESVKVGTEVATKEGEKAVAGLLQKEITGGTKTLAERISEKGVSQLPGKTPLLGGVSFTAMKELRQQTAKEISEILAKQGINMGEQAIEGIIKKQVLKSAMKSDLWRVPLYAGTNISVDVAIRVNELAGKDVVSAKGVEEAARTFYKENKADYDKLSPIQKEQVLRDTHDLLINGGKIIQDEKGKPISADEVVHQNLGSTPSSTRVNEQDIEDTVIEHTKKKLGLKESDRLSPQQTAEALKAKEILLKQFEDKGYTVEPKEEKTPSTKRAPDKAPGNEQQQGYEYVR